MSFFIMLLQAAAETQNQPNWNIIIPSFFGLVTTCFGAYFAYKANQVQKGVHAIDINTVGAKASADKAADKAATAAEKVEAVKEELASHNTHADAQRTRIEDTGDKIHTLVNSNMSEQLKISALALRRIADLTGDKNDAAVAEAAEAAYNGHEKKQAVVDAAEKGS